MSLKFGNNPVVRIELSPGIYLLPPESAIGKSYMCKIFKDIGRVSRVTGHEFPDDLDVDKVLNNSLRDVVIFDRYDMCTSDFTKEMQNFAKSGVLLLDSKTHLRGLGCRSCMMDMNKDELVVW